MPGRECQRHELVDGNGRRLPFALVPAAKPKESPLLVAFHGWTGGLNVERNFDTLITPAYVDQYPENWNILIPQDRYGFGRCGSWWLGEKGDFFLLLLLDGMIRLAGNTCGFNGDIYTYGISMGGFGAILHGLRWKARAICANVPQIRLLDTELTERNARMLKAVFGAEDFDRLRRREDRDERLAALSRYADVTSFLDGGLPKSRKPTFLLAQSRYDISPNYAREHCFYLVDKLLTQDFNFDLRVFPEFGHKEYVGVLEALRWFEDKREAILNGVENDYNPDTNANSLYCKNVLAEFDGIG